MAKLNAETILEINNNNIDYSIVISKNKLYKLPFTSSASTRENKTITTTSYTLQEEDKNKFLIFTNGLPITVEIPIGLSENASYMLLQQGPGKVIINLLSTATVSTAATLDGGTKERYSVLEIRCVDINSYVLYGEQGAGGF
jgi:hypothetical protein